MNAAEIARKTLAPGEGHYEKLTRDEIYSLCCAAQDAEAYKKRVEGGAHADGCAHAAASRSLEWIIKHCADPERAAWSKYRGMDSIRHKAEYALKCLQIATASKVTP